MTRISVLGLFLTVFSVLGLTLNHYLYSIEEGVLVLQESAGLLGQGLQV